MCGITGFIDFNIKSNQEILDSMVDSLSHRGPDDQGSEIYSLKNVQIGFGHTRLSIIDLSSAGHQPMHYENYSIILNGEIYNYEEIKATLINEGYSFVSNSDTEVILKSFIHWGKDCVKYFIGMFVFVILDRLNESISFCRDRAGIKPLYIYENEGLILFSSELKSFHKHPYFQKSINHYALYDFMQFGYVSGNQSIFNYCEKLPPANWITIDLLNRKKEYLQYWNVIDYFKKPLLKLTHSEVKESVENIIKSAFNYRMVADVPVGVFLSGGYDSSLVTAILQKDSVKKIKTFTIGFPDGIDESEYAQKVADHLGTDHTNYNCTHKDAQEIIPDLPYYYDEPFADISAIPSILVSKLAREKVTVALSADGGDELFAGYTWYSNFHKRLKEINSIPEKLKPIASFVLKHFSRIIPNNKIQLKHRIQGLSKILNIKKNQQLIELMYHSRRLPDEFNKKLFINVSSKKPKIFSKKYKDLNSEFASMLVIDYKMNLTDCLLVKVDRATMSTSLEGREPLMDHRLAELAAQLPMEYKFDGKTHKKLLREITHQYIPSSIMERPKVGFDLPVFDYLKNELSYLIEEYLSEKAILDSNVFNPDFVTQLVKDFKDDRLLYKTVIWRLLMFQMWYAKWM